MRQTSEEYLPRQRWRSGEYHKHGKWSYTEGGVALREGIVIVNSRSTHTSANNVKKAIVVQENKIRESAYIMQTLESCSERPTPCKGYSFLHENPDVWKSVVDAVLDWYRLREDGEQKVSEALSRWETIEKFL